MINGRDVMLDSVKTELTFLKKMRQSALDNIAMQEKLIEMNRTKLCEAHDMMARFEQRADMCCKLQESLNDFQAGLDALSESKGEPR